MGGGAGAPGHWEVGGQAPPPLPHRQTAVSRCPRVPIVQTPRHQAMSSRSPPRTLSAHPLVCPPLQCLLFSPWPPTPALPLAPVLSPLPLPASLPASLSARLQLGDNLPHLASWLLPRLIAQLVPGARPSFFPTPTPSPAPKLSHPLPAPTTRSQGTGCPLQ